MNFALDLLDVVTEQAPAALLSIVRQAAEEGSHLVVSRWLEVQMSRSSQEPPLDFGADDGPFVNAMLSLAARSDGKRGDPSSVAFGQWAQAALSEKPERFSDLLNWCVHSSKPTLDAAGSELLALGANPLSSSRPDDSGESFELSGVKLGLRERNATLVALAMSTRHPLTGELVAKSSDSKIPWPVVSEVCVDGRFHKVNAAGYAIALGDARMLREVCKRTNGDEHKMRIGLGEAVDFALSSGISQKCTPDMAQCVAICIASGADLDHSKIGQRLVSHRVTLAPEVSDFQYEGHQGFHPEQSYSMASLFISNRTGAESLNAISKLVNDYQMDLNGPVTQAGSRASMLHYAAASGHVDLVKGLLVLGAAPDAIDARGLTASLWAQVYERAAVHLALDPRNISKLLSGTGNGVEFVPRSGSHGSDDGPAWGDLDEGVSLDEGEAMLSDLAPMDVTAKSPSHAHSSPSVGALSPGVAVDRTAAPSTTPGRDHVAASASEAQASRGAALFSRLKSSQATITAKAAAKDEAKEIENKAEQSGRSVQAPVLSPFRARA